MDIHTLGDICMAVNKPEKHVQETVLHILGHTVGLAHANVLIKYFRSIMPTCTGLIGWLGAWPCMRKLNGLVYPTKFCLSCACQIPSWTGLLPLVRIVLFLIFSINVLGGPVSPHAQLLLEGHISMVPQCTRNWAVSCVTL